MPKPLHLLTMLTSAFTKPAAALFLRIAEGWALCPSRRTLTNVYRFQEQNHTTNVDATHYFFRDAAWDYADIWPIWARLLVERFAKNQDTITLTLDDTTHHKTGPKVNGARTCRDAVRSTRNKVVHCWALQFVPLCLLVRPPWGGEPLSLPVNIRLNRKAKEGEEPVTLLDNTEAMVRELAQWLPDKRFKLVVDGAYAPLAGRKLPRTTIISRLRADAAIYDLPPPRRPGHRGRPATKGKRLPTPKTMARCVRKWRRVRTQERGHERERLVYVRSMIWAKVSKAPVLLVISRDPSGREADDFFLSTDVSEPGAEVVSLFSDRWTVEDTFRNVKQYLGAEEPQSWTRAGPERAGAFSYLMYGAVWVSRIERDGDAVAALDRPWYPQKRCVSFLDALADLRSQLWTFRIKSMFSSGDDVQKIEKVLIEAASWAA